MNMRVAPFDNLTFREAMLYGFDRENALAKVLAGYGEVLNPGLFSSAYDRLGWRNSSVDAYPYDPQKAGALLDTLGYTVSASGVRVDPSTGQQLRTLFIFSRLTDPASVAAADLFARDMRAIGLPVISFPVSDVDFNVQTKMTYYFDMYVDTVSAGPAPTWLADLFASSNDLSPAPLATNLVGYHNRTFDASLEQLLTATDSKEARNAALRCQEQLGMDVPAIPVYSRNLIIVTSPNFTKVVPVTGSAENTLAQSLAATTTGITVIGETSGLTSLNPTLTLGPADLLTLKLVTQPLFQSDANGALLPGLVANWQLSDNSTRFSIVLRERASFGDGVPITSHDLAATLEWLASNALPSSPFYSAVDQTRSVTEVDARTVDITLRQPNSLIANEFANLFALPATLLPPTNTPLGLLRDGGLVSSGPFTLVKFVQGMEADLAHNIPLPNGDWSSANLVNMNGVEAQELLGMAIGGSVIHIFAQPLSYQGQQIRNATLTAQVINSNGELEAICQGSYLGFGIYSAPLNLNTQPLPAGHYALSTQLYAELPSGAIIQYGGGTLTSHPPLLMLQLIIYVVALASVIAAVWKAGPARPKRRVRRTPKPRRRKRITRSRKKT
jgi:ABC-type transport system substrate-binding protein